jgi:peptidoglycan hydrolase-like protein with peptidoglycan-binding domain
MKRFLLSLLAISLCGVGSLWADENVQAAQRRLKDAGFYFGDTSGVYDSETAAAVTRYQIRHGLAISGRLDAATAEALGVSAAKTGAAEPTASSGTWRRLRNGDMQFLKQLHSGVISPPGAGTRPSLPAHSPQPSPARPMQKRRFEPPAEAPPPAEDSVPPNSPPAPAPVMTSARPLSNNAIYSPERLRDYVAAFVLAGLDPQVGAELEFFADRVDYFGEHNVDQKKIQRDLLRYDQRWPQRRYWLAGNLKVERQSGGKLKVIFPLRYELRSRSQHSSGKVMKTLTLQKTAGDDLQIVAVNEQGVH